MKKYLLLTMTIWMFSGPWAQADKIVIRSLDYTCDQLQSYVQQYGEVYIKSIGTTRFVANPSYCDPRKEVAHQANVPSKDKLFCTAGLICKRSNANEH
ncbi:MAG: hypothetical protein KDD34_10170 [Bdellovibrionales bacterium]|nr:hypothetical protein [Bdellovibrionales bacterium]